MSKIKIKRLIKKAGKILLILWFVCLAWLVGLVMLTKGDEITLPVIAGIFVVVIFAATVLCILAAFAIDMAEKIKEKGIIEAPRFFLDAALCLAIVLLYDYFEGTPNIDLPSAAGRAVIVVCGIRAGRYIFT